MQLISDSFDNNGFMNVKYAHERVDEGKNISPSIKWENVHENIKSFVITVVDNHPIASKWVHWMVINIPASVTELPEGVSGKSGLPSASMELENTFGFNGYGGPMPPIGSGKHNYVFTIYALDIEKVDLSRRVSEDILLKNIRSHILDKASITAYYER